MMLESTGNDFDPRRIQKMRSNSVTVGKGLRYSRLSGAADNRGHSVPGLFSTAADGFPAIFYRDGSPSGRFLTAPG